jgi:hypothetical protein
MKRSLTFSLLIVLLGLAVAWGYEGENFFILNWDGMRYDAIEDSVPKHLLNDLAPEGIFFKRLCNAWWTLTSPGHANIHTGNPHLIPNARAQTLEDMWHLDHYVPSLMEAYVKERGGGPADSVLAWVFGNSLNDYAWGYSRHPDYPDFSDLTAVHAARYIVDPCPDTLLWELMIKPALDEYEPDFIYVDFHDVDRHGHQIDPQNPGPGTAKYLRAIEIVDSLTYLILHEYIPNNPKYAGKTNVLIISDHGRHTDGVNNGLTSHGCDCEGCRHVMGLLWGPDFKDGLTTSELCYQTEFAHTIAHLLGLKAPHARTSKIHTELLVAPEPEQWTPQPGGGEPISADEITGSRPDLAVSDNGRVHVVWCEDHRAIKYRRKENGSWSEPLTLARTQAQGWLLQTPRVSSRGSVVAVCWERFRMIHAGFLGWYLELVISPNGGRTWSAIQRNVFDLPVLAGDLALGQDQRGMYLAVAGTHGPDRGDRLRVTELRVKKGRVGEAWQEKLFHSFPTPSRVQYLDLRADGANLSLACECLWEPHHNIEVVNFRSEDHAETWTEPIFITDDPISDYCMHDYHPCGLVMELTAGLAEKGDHSTPNGPSSPVLAQCYANPFNPSTTISYNIPEAGHVRLEVFNLKGQRVETLVDEHQLPGSYSAVWNAEDYCSGLYLYKLTAEEYTETKKMLLVK